MRTRLITAAYVLTLDGIVFLADGGAAQDFFRLVRAVPFGDKLGHFVLMGLLSLLVNLCLSCRAVKLAGFRLLLGSALVLLPVAAEEFSQLLTPHRSFDLIDLLFDAGGIFVFGRLARRAGAGRGTAPCPSP